MPVLLASLGSVLGHLMTGRENGCDRMHKLNVTQLSRQPSANQKAAPSLPERRQHLTNLSLRPLSG